MANSSTNMEQVSFSQALAATVINALVDAMSQAAFGGRARASTSGTTWGVIRGSFSSAGSISTLADTTVNLTSNATNYVELDSDGAISANTTAFTPGRGPLYEVAVNSGGTVTSYTDRRVFYRAWWINERLALTFSSDANKTLTAAEARASFLDFTSGGTTLTATRDVIVPLNIREISVRNNSPGSQDIRIIGASGTGVTIGNGDVAKVMGDGTNIVEVVSGGGGSGVTSLTGDVTGTGPGATSTTIANDAVSNAKLANMATQTIKGRTTAGTGDPEDLSATQATAILNAMVGDSGSGGTKGLVPAPSSGDAAAGKFLKADGTWAVASGGVSDGDKGDITVSSSGATWTVDNDAISNAKLANVSTQTIKGRTSASTGDPEDLTAAQAAAVIQGDGLTVDLAGFRGIPQNAQSGNYTLVAADAGKHICHASGAGSGDTYTIPANGSVAFPIGTTVTFANMDSNAVSIAITTDTLYLANSGTTGTRSLAQYGIATAIKVASTVWLISGSGLS